jgi:hypothetical protein
LFCARFFIIPATKDPGEGLEAWSLSVLIQDVTHVTLCPAAVDAIANVRHGFLLRLTLHSRNGDKLITPPISGARSVFFPGNLTQPFQNRRAGNILSDMTTGATIIAEKSKTWHHGTLEGRKSRVWKRDMSSG